MTIPPVDSGAGARRERDKKLVELWKSCWGAFLKVLSELAEKEHTNVPTWLKRRGLSDEEVFNGVFPAVLAAQAKFDPGHKSGASFPTFAKKTIKGEVARIAKDSSHLAADPFERLGGIAEAEEEEQTGPRGFTEHVELAYSHSASEIVQAVYQETKFPDEQPSEKLRRIADQIGEEFSEELAQNVKVQALHSMLIAQAIRAEDHEGQMVLISTLVHLLAIREHRKAEGMPAESYSPSVLAKVFGRPSNKTLGKWLKSCDAQGITSENWTPEQLAKIISSKRGPSFRGRLNRPTSRPNK